VIIKEKSIDSWLLSGDVAIQYQTYRDLLGTERPDLQKRIATEGWGARFLSKQRPDGHWGLKFYQPKWTSTHYTLQDLRHLCISPDIRPIREVIDSILHEERSKDGGINPIGTVQQSDMCINGMFLNYACYFGVREEDLKPVVDFILTGVMPDGGFNCRFNRSGAVHSSLHTTLSVLEGIEKYRKNQYQYRIPELLAAQQTSVEFILRHQLFLSERSGEIIHKDFLKLAYPFRWRYDILRALDYFQYARIPYDHRMDPALRILLEKKAPDSTWKVPAKHPGQVHFEMEPAGKPSRWNTLRALRVIKQYSLNLNDEN
jgi:hypothetical protein